MFPLRSADSKEEYGIKVFEKGDKKSSVVSAREFNSKNLTQNQSRKSPQNRICDK